MGSARPPSQRLFLVVFAAVLAALLGACASTRITSEWKDESLERVAFRKVLAVFQTADPALRRIAEDEMARAFPNAEPSYRVLRDEEIRDLDRVRARVRELGFDSMVIMRVVAVEKQETYVPPARWVVPLQYVDLWGYWNFGWTVVYEPGYLRTDRIVRIATTIYSIPEDKLVFASESETFEPASLPKAVADAVKVVAREIRK
jgi:hypothetical protein